VTTGPGTDAAAAALEALRAKYRAGLGATLGALEQLAAQVDALPTEPAVLESLRREVHRLHGSAGTYGFTDASRLAAALESRLVVWSGDPHAEVTARAQIIGNFIRAFRTTVSGPASGTDGESTTRVVGLVGVEEAEAERINAEAVLRGFAMIRLAAEQLTREELESMAPRVLVVPAALLGRVPAGLGLPIIAIAERRRSRTGRAPRKPDVPVITMDADAAPAAILDVVEEVVRRADHGGATLLVVDDDPAMLLVVRTIAEYDGLHVETVDSASAVRDAIARCAPALVLMDIHLGDGSGIDLARSLRMEPGGNDLQILLFSGRKDAATRERAFRAGADDFFAKPVVPGELRRRLNERLERRRLRRLEAGIHPLLDVTLADRTTRDAAAAWSAAGKHTMTVIRPAPGFDNRAWVNEVRRLAASLTPVARALGFDQDDALLGVFDIEALEIVHRLESLRAARPDGSPVWHAGIAAGPEAGAAFTQARRSAHEALDVARRAADPGIHRWTLADDAAAPDVIVVEDDHALADMVEYALRLGGYTYRAFSDGTTAYEAMLAMRTGSRRPVVLLDVDLPGMDGHSLHERLRIDRPGAFVVVFVSVHAGEGDQVRALNAGAWDYLAKPLNLRVLLAKLPVWLTRAAAEP
jgi:DNA-binding response OmpR family regulator